MDILRGALAAVIVGVITRQNVLAKTGQHVCLSMNYGEDNLSDGDFPTAAPR